MFISKFFKTDTGKILLSIILGLGLASLFKKICNDKKNCLLFKAPSLVELENNVFKYDNSCIKYKSNLVKCDNDKKIINFS